VATWFPLFCPRYPSVASRRLTQPLGLFRAFQKVLVYGFCFGTLHSCLCLDGWYIDTGASILTFQRKPQNVNLYSTTTIPSRLVTVMLARFGQFKRHANIKLRRPPYRGDRLADYASCPAGILRMPPPHGIQILDPDATGTQCI
jgi:hypothetical protein